jgi:hypothetical protein
MGEAGWYCDPVARGQHRYFNGVQWTDQIAALGVQRTDPNRALGRVGPPTGRPIVAAQSQSVSAKSPTTRRETPSASQPFEKRNERRMLERQAASLRRNWYLMECRAMYWMKAHGYPDAKLGSNIQVRRELGFSSFATSDEGVDVLATAAVAQVKAHAKPVGLADVQRHYGVACALGRTPLFFSTSGYTRAAEKFARDRVALLLITVGIAGSPSQQIPVSVKRVGHS